MQLKVYIPPSREDDAGEGREVVVSSFRDVVRIGSDVARQVREWLRQVPMTPHVKQFNAFISAEWVENPKPAEVDEVEQGASKPKRKKKSKK